MSIHLENNIRPDGREVNEFRQLIISVGSIGTACGSALVKMNKTVVLCGIKADLTNPTQDEPDKGFFVPNVTLTPVCSNKFQPGPPTEQAQVCSQIIMNLLKNSNFINPNSLCIAEGKLSWCLFIEMVCLSYDGNVLDACVLALMAALRNTKLPEVTVKEEDNKVEVTEKYAPLNIDHLIFPTTFAVLKNGVVADPSTEEESLADGSLMVLLKGDGSTSIESFGSIKEEQIFSCIECSKVRYEEMKKILEALN